MDEPAPPYRCRVCDATGAFPAVVAREMMFGLREPFRYRQCAACETLQIEAVPSDLGRHYGGAYYSFQRVAESGLKTRVRNRVLGLRERAYLTPSSPLRRVFDALIPPVEHTRLVLDALRAVGARPSWRILDVGCGGGTIMHRLRNGGFGGTAGVDPFIPETFTYRNGLRILKGEIADVEPGLDLITFHHSLEHVVDPTAVLVAARAKLSAGGRILVRVPTVSSYAWEHYGVDWVQLDAPRHLFLFSRRALAVLARRAGLRIVGQYDDSTALQFLGSEQLKADIPLDSERSYTRNPRASIFSEAQVAAFARRAAELNAQGRGDQVVAWLEAETRV
jgi:SAM-dependent methyltransferase